MVHGQAPAPTFAGRGKTVRALTQASRPLPDQKPFAVMIPVNDPLKKILSPIKELQNIRGVALPIGLEFLQLVITGPPGAGKSYYINQIGGWPNEGYIDLTHNNWWKNQSLVYRPREIHLGLPFAGMAEGLTVFDKEYLDCQPRPALELSRIKIPPAGSGLFATNWRDRYIFEFLIPDPEVVFSQRQARQSRNRGLAHATRGRGAHGEASFRRGAPTGCMATWRFYEPTTNACNAMLLTSAAAPTGISSPTAWATGTTTAMASPPGMWPMNR